MIFHDFFMMSHDSSKSEVWDQFSSQFAPRITNVRLPGHILEAQFKSKNLINFKEVHSNLWTALVGSPIYFEAVLAAKQFGPLEASTQKPLDVEKESK